MSGGSNPSRPVFFMDAFIFILVLFLIAYLYSVTGHGGGSAYLALFLLLGSGPTEAKFFALSLNVIVAFLAFFNFKKAGFLDFALVWPLLLGSMPAVFLSAKLPPGIDFYNQVVGFLLIVLAVKLFRKSKNNFTAKKKPKTLILIFTGFLIGALAGFIGIGGGIFLSPILIFFGWANPRKTAAASSIFVLANSFLGVVSIFQTFGEKISEDVYLPSAFLLFGSIVALASWMGSSLGSKRLNKFVMNRALGVILLIASLRLFL